MADWSNPWIIGAATTLFGVLLARMIDFAQSSFEVRRRADLTGTWLSVSHGGDQPAVRDTIHIGIKHGKLHFSNVEKPYGYHYEAFCRVRDGRLVVGNWRSLRPGAPARGEVLLVVDSQGTHMYGVYSGMDAAGRNMVLGWALGRNQAALAAALHALRDFTSLPPVK